MPGKQIEINQVRVYMKSREFGLTQAEAADVAGFSERSGQRIEAGDYQPNRGKVREWRTSCDP
jgi:DNA-binding XRE family transcriptional regulator